MHIDSDEAETADIDICYCIVCQLIYIAVLLNEHRIIEYHVTFCVDIFLTVRHCPELVAFRAEVLYLCRCDDKGQLLGSQRLRVKGKRPDALAFDIVEDPLRFRKSELYHSRPHTEVGDTESICHRGSDPFKQLTSVRIRACFPDSVNDHAFCICCRHPETMCSSVSLVLHKK
ncbi:MAG: hypothetical protein BWZ04_03077 [Firmicutes bacterium ADurb.BinA205]|nr:MAG: hypothetical protein BWZ04_03077 [Firmicutes bacterium ADurb.BinA205]